MHYIWNLFPVKIDKLQTSCLWAVRICLSLSWKALESESKLKETSFFKDVLRRFGCLVSISPKSLFSQWFISCQTFHSGRLEQDVYLDCDGAFFCPVWAILMCNDVDNLQNVRFPSGPIRYSQVPYILQELCLMCLVIAASLVRWGHFSLWGDKAVEHWRRSTAPTELPPGPEATAKRGLWLGGRGHLVPAGNLCPLLKSKAKWDLVSCNYEPRENLPMQM